MKFSPIVLLATLLIVSFMPLQSKAQQFSLPQYNADRVRITQNAMVALGTWAVGNIGVGLIAGSRADGQTKYFHQMNAIWNTANLGIAILGYTQARKAADSSSDWKASLDAQRRIQRIYLINGGLDLVYIGAGAYLRSRGNKSLNSHTRDQLHGYGGSIIFQGAFLLLYDVVNYTIHYKHGHDLFAQSKNIQLSMAPNRVSVLYEF